MFRINGRIFYWLIYKNTYYENITYIVIKGGFMGINLNEEGDTDVVGTEVYDGQVCECCPQMATEESFGIFYCDTCYRIEVLHYIP